MFHHPPNSALSPNSLKTALHTARQNYPFPISSGTTFATPAAQMAFSANMPPSQTDSSFEFPRRTQGLQGIFSREGQGLEKLGSNGPWDMAPAPAYQQYQPTRPPLATNSSSSSNRGRRPSFRIDIPTAEPTATPSHNHVDTPIYAPAPRSFQASLTSLPESSYPGGYYIGQAGDDYASSGRGVHALGPGSGYSLNKRAPTPWIKHDLEEILSADEGEEEGTVGSLAQAVKNMQVNEMMRANGGRRV